MRKFTVMLATVLISSSLTTQAQTSIDTLPQKIEFRLSNDSLDLITFPNPVSNILNIKCSKLATDVGLYNALGKLLQPITLTENSGSYTATISVTSLTDGLYIINGSYKNTTLTKRIIVSKE